MSSPKRMILEASGQSWKLLALGIGAPALVFLPMLVPGARAGAIAALIALPCAFAIAVALVMSTKCPRCGAPWIWLAMTASGYDKYSALLRAEGCPKCGATAAQMTREDRRSR